MAPGELHLQHGNETKEAGDFREAMAVAKRISSSSYQLRVTWSFAPLLAKQSKRKEARAILAEIYGQFIEGFGTAG